MANMKNKCNKSFVNSMEIIKLYQMTLKKAKINRKLISHGSILCIKQRVI